MDWIKANLAANWKSYATAGVSVLLLVHGTYDWPDAKVFAMLTGIATILGIWAGHAPATDKTTPQN